MNTEAGDEGESGVALAPVPKDPPLWFTALTLAGGAGFILIAAAMGWAAVWAEGAAEPGSSAQQIAESVPPAKVARGKAQTPANRSRDCPNCNHPGTMCRGDVCVFDPEARWQLRPIGVELEGRALLLRHALIRVCVSPDGTSQWKCTKAVTPGATAEEWEAWCPDTGARVDLDGEELLTRGIWVRVLNHDEEIFEATQRVHRNLVPGAWLSNGGVRFSGDDGLVRQLHFKLEPADAAND